MIRKFYYHPDRQKEVGNALIAGSLVASQEQLVASEFMPLVDDEGKPTMGWWIDEFSPDDFFLMPKVPEALFVYGKHLMDISNILSGVPPMDISESMEKTWAEDEALKAQWYLGDYVPTGCENCGRMRVCACPNGKHRCEKCNWCPEDQMYAPNV